MTSAETETLAAGSEADAGRLSESGDRRPAPARRSRLARAAREHWLLAAVLGAAALIRLATDVSYSALVTPDSWTYVKIAFEGSPVGFAPDRPSGYPLLIKLLSLGGASLDTVTAIQHVAGLVTAVLVYALLVRLEVPRWAAAAATAVVALDSFAVTLGEQTIMAETFFTLCVTASVFLATVPTRRAWALPASGALLAVAATIRTMAVFAIPVLLLYVLWTAPGWRRRAAALAGVLTPLVIYAGAQGLSTGYFGLTEGDGWFLYGRVASLIPCAPNGVPPQTRFLCASAGQAGRRLGLVKTEDYVFNPKAPARQRFGGMYWGDLERRQQVNKWLRAWALASIAARPLRYAAGVGEDFSNYLVPSAAVPSSFTLIRPREPFFAGFEEENPVQRQYVLDVQRRYAPTYRREAFGPAWLRTYQGWFQMPYWLITIVAIVALVAAVGLTARRRPLRHGKEAIFILTSALLILLGAVASSVYQDRFAPSLLPLLVTGSVLVAAPLLHRRRGDA